MERTVHSRSLKVVAYGRARSTQQFFGFGHLYVLLCCHPPTTKGTNVTRNIHTRHRRHHRRRHHLHHQCIRRVVGSAACSTTLITIVRAVPLPWKQRRATCRTRQSKTTPTAAHCALPTWRAIIGRSHTLILSPPAFRRAITHGLEPHHRRTCTSPGK